MLLVCKGENRSTNKKMCKLACTPCVCIFLLLLAKLALIAIPIKSALFLFHATAFCAVFLLEFLDAACGIDDFLLTGVKRVRFG